MNKLVILFLLLPAFVWSQKIENSPYSRYGLGELFDPAIVAYRAMGYTSIANSDKYHINLTNPAALGSLGTTAFEVGSYAKRTSFTEGEIKESSWSGNLDYIGIGFPLKNPINQVYEAKKKPYSLGMSFSLNRLSRISYNIASLDSIEDVGRFERTYSGTGGSYKIQWGNAILYKQFSFGLNLGYLFGNAQLKKEITFGDLDFPSDNAVDRSYGIGAFTLTAGLMYNHSFNEKIAKENPSIPLKTLRIGAIFSPAFGANTSTDELILSRQIIGSNIVVIDTVSKLEDIEGKAKLGSEFGVGFLYSNGDKSAFAGDLKIGSWSKYYNNASGEDEGALKNSLHASFGAYFRPNFKSYSSFWKRAFYKYGAYYDVDPRVVLDKQIKSYGLTFGLGLPFVFQRKIAHTDIGFDLGNRGSGTVIEEKFIKINFGFTFNDDEWFIKRKYN